MKEEFTEKKWIPKKKNNRKKKKSLREYKQERYQKLNNKLPH